MAYLTAADLRSVRALEDNEKFPDEDLDGLVAEFEELAENHLGVAYEPRTLTETVAARGRWLRPTWPEIRSVASITVVSFGSSVALPSTSWQIHRTAGVIDLAGEWFGEATIVYSHGLDAPTPMLLRACKEYVRSVALRTRSDIGRDVKVQAMEGGGTNVYVMPDEDHPTGYTEVDRLLMKIAGRRSGGVG